jgi:hypothetical protein
MYVVRRTGVHNEFWMKFQWGLYLEANKWMVAWSESQNGNSG